MFAEQFNGELVLSLPDVANYNDSNGFLPALAKKINAKLGERKFKLQVSKILDYSTSQSNQKEEKFEDRAIAKIQDHMYQTEQNMVASLVSQGRLNQKNFLVKDGSLEYRIVSELASDKRKFLTFKSNYGYVIGFKKI